MFWNVYNDLPEKRANAEQYTLISDNMEFEVLTEVLLKIHVSWGSFAVSLCKKFQEFWRIIALSSSRSFFSDCLTENMNDTMLYPRKQESPLPLFFPKTSTKYRKKHFSTKSGQGLYSKCIFQISCFNIPLWYGGNWDMTSGKITISVNSITTETFTAIFDNTSSWMQMVLHMQGSHPEYVITW